MIAICRQCKEAKPFKDHTAEDICEDCYDKAMNEMNCWQSITHVKNCVNCLKQVNK